MKWVAINQLRLRKPLVILTIQPKKYLKWTAEFQHNGNKLHILINYEVICHTLQSINKFYFANAGIETGTWVTKIQITWVKTNPLGFREPLKIQTIQPIKYLKWANELGYNGHMLHILMNYKVIRHTLTYWEIIISMIIPIHITYSLIYSSLETADVRRYWQLR